jgi:hypothetical protein
MAGTPFRLGRVVDHPPTLNPGYQITHQKRRMCQSLRGLHQ